MNYKRVLTVQDISCVGQCSITVALPVLSACGVETAVLPSAVLSTHTGGFTDFTFRDLTEDIPAICDHWQKEGIAFDAVYTGYLGSLRQIDLVKDIFRTLPVEGGLRIVDPVMADHGKLYPGFDEEYAMAMRDLCSCADIIIPNITEACFMTGHPYQETYDEAYIQELVAKLVGLGCGCVVLTGVSYEAGKTGVLIAKDGKTEHYCHDRVGRNYHGTGDVFASAFVGALMRGKNLLTSAKVAADYTALCIQKTVEDESHWYGVKFETVLGQLIESLA